MSQPPDVPSLPALASRVLDIVAADLAPAFVAALVRHAAKDLTPKITKDELDAVTRELPAAAADHAATELDVIIAQLIAQHRSQDRAARTYQDTMAGFGPRAAGAGLGRDPAPRPSTAPGWPAIPLSGTPGMAEHPGDRYPSERRDPCAIAGTSLGLAEIHLPIGLVSEEYVTAAGVVAVIYQVVDRIGAFRAVDRAIQQLDSDELCIDTDQVGLQNRLACWNERDNRVKAPERARLVAKILGLKDPNLPEGASLDTVIPGLLDDLLDAINASCDPGVFRDAPTSADIVRLRLATRAVQVRFSSSVTGYSVLRIKDLQVQFSRGLGILRDLAPFVQRPCRPRGDQVAERHASMQPEWISVSALNGTRLPDGTDLFDAVATARAWQIVFDDWLTDDGNAEADAMRLARTPSRKVCEAAALLRPTRTRHDRYGYPAASSG